MFGGLRRQLAIGSVAFLLVSAVQSSLGTSAASAKDETLEASHEAPEPAQAAAREGRGHRPPITRKPGKEAEEHAEHAEHVPHPMNAVGLGFMYSAHFIDDAEAHGESSPVNLYGFSLFYERVLIPGHLALSVRKPFLFTGDGFDSPLDVAIEGLLHRNHWELFVGAGLGFNVRVFDRELEGEESGVDFSLGIPVFTGVNLLVTHDWAIQLEAGYTWVATDEPVNHEVSALLTMLYLF